MIRWFCICCSATSSRPDDVLDDYPVDRLMHDIALALMAVQTQTTDDSRRVPYEGGDGTGDATDGSGRKRSRCSDAA